MRNSKQGPSLGQDLAALVDLYLTFLWMLRQRLHYGRGWQYHHRTSPAHADAAGRAGEREPEGEPAHTRR